MDYFKEAEVLASQVLVGTNEYFDRHIRNELSDYSGEFILGIFPYDSELLVLDKDSNGFNLEDREAEMEYIYKSIFERTAPMYLHGKDGKVAKVTREKAFNTYVLFCADLLGSPKLANTVEG